MTKENLINMISRATRMDTISAEELDLYRTNVECDGKVYDVYLAGNDEMFDLNEFYQIGIDPINDKTYKFFFEVGENERRKRMISEAQKRAARKYESSLEQIKFRAPIGTREKLKKAAEAAGLSVNQFLADLVDKELENR